MIEQVWPSSARGKNTQIFKGAPEQTAQQLNALKGHPDVEIDLRITPGARLPVGFSKDRLK
jgi:hypothetical protein